VTVWVANRSLWDRMIRKVAKEVPFMTRKFWRRVLQEYISAGGPLFEEEQIEGEELGDLD